MGKQYITFHLVTMKTFISGLWRRFTTALRLPNWACRLPGSTMLQSRRKNHTETANASSGRDSCNERKPTGKHQECNDVDYHWVEVDERTRSFLPNNMEKFIEHRLSGDYWIKEMGGGRIS